MTRTTSGGHLLPKPETQKNLEKYLQNLFNDSTSRQTKWLPETEAVPKELREKTVMTEKQHHMFWSLVVCGSSVMVWDDRMNCCLEPGSQILLGSGLSYKHIKRLIEGS